MASKIMTEKYLLGIDFGGGSAKATLISTEGKIISECSAEYPTYHPQNGFCEQSPEDWKNALGTVCSSLIKNGSVDPRDILAVAVDSATHTAVLCDEDYNVLCNAIHWTDSRSAEQSRFLSSAYGEMIFGLTFHKPDTIWTMPQLLWIRQNKPDLFKRIKHVAFEKDYLRFLLTGVWCTDYIEAAGSMLFDVNEGKWSAQLCDLTGIDKSVFPEVTDPLSIVGKINGYGASLTGLSSDTFVVCGTTDTAMEILASGSIKKSDTTVKLATAGRICVITDKPFPDRDLVNYRHVEKGLWYPGTATKAAASSLRWYRDTFGDNYTGIDEKAKDIPIGCDGLFFHPYINGELTPYADPSLCGSFVGIRSTHTKAHFDRSILEGVAFSLLHSLKKLESIGIEHSSVATLIGGGAKSLIWGRIVSDCLGISLSVNENSDSSLGSAMLAGVSLGVFGSFEDAINKCVKRVCTIDPIYENTVLYNRLFEKYVKIHDALAPLYHGELL
ncbi:MAG: hypothetical protein J5850_06090 [Clostridia bacterium]|nr:hypothetical protein [Clostridia bacterium]